jgi:riboflavin kinase/FMN adenylyltransferase
LRIVRGLSSTRMHGDSVITIGAFDGIHIGHRRILDEVVLLARGLGIAGVVVTFEPHPISILQPSEAQCLLTSLDERAKLIGEIGVDSLVLLRFSSKLAQRSAEWFVKKVLLEKLGLRRLVIGYDFRFGRNRQGDASYLETLGERVGFGVDIVPPVGYMGHPVSATRVRTALLRGDVEAVSEMLGRMYSIRGEVVKGEGRGRILTYPTANLKPLDGRKMLPANGVYAVTVRVADEENPGVLYIGTKPTFDGCVKGLEVHIMDLDEDLYGSEVEVLFAKRLREEIRFGSDQELKRAIVRDVAEARRTLSI